MPRGIGAPIPLPTWRPRRWTCSSAKGSRWTASMSVSPSSPSSRRSESLRTIGVSADKYCSPTRTAIQSGRNPYHVNPLNADPDIYNPADPVSGMASMPRNSPSPLFAPQPGAHEAHRCRVLVRSDGHGDEDGGRGIPDAYVRQMARPPQPSFFCRRSDPDGAFCAQGCG